MQVSNPVSSIIHVKINFFRNFELYHVLTYTPLLEWMIETCIALNLMLLSIF